MRVLMDPNYLSLLVMALAFNPRGIHLGGRDRPAWSTKQVPGLPRQHRETLSQKSINKQTNKQINK